MRTDSGGGLMRQWIKEFFRKFHELPANLPDRHYRFFVFSNYAFLLAGLFHLAFIFIFARIDLPILSVYNIFSTLLWVLCIYLNLRGWWIAAVYVQSILPAPIDDGPVRSNWDFIPSESLGGDAFGYEWLDQDRFAIYLLDVSGHGVSAALLSATIANVLRTRALPQVDFGQPDQVLSALNRSFPSDVFEDDFTMLKVAFNESR